MDETDNSQKMDAAEDREESFRWARLRLLNSKIVDQNLSYEEARAVTAHLLHNYPKTVSLLTENQLSRLIAETPVKVLPTAVLDITQVMPKDLLYEKNVFCDFATLILTGKVTVVAGADDFRTDCSNWALLGRNALVDPSYRPDFSAYVSSGPCRCIFIKRARFSAAVDASVLERRAAAHGSLDIRADNPPSSNHGSETPDEQNREMGKQEKLLTALNSVGKSDTIELTSDGRPIVPGPGVGLIKRPSLINVTTVPRTESSDPKGKGGRS